MQTMTKTRSKTSVKLAVATAALFVAAAAALMIDSESGTETESVYFCATYDKGIVVQEKTDSVMQTLVSGCQKSGWGMSKVFYSCGGLEGAYWNSENNSWEGDGSYYKMDWQPCAGGDIEVASGPAMIIATSPNTPKQNNYSLGDKDLTLASFDFSSNPNSSEQANLKLTEVAVRIASNGARDCLTNYRLVNEGKNNIAAPVAKADVKNKEYDYIATVKFSDISTIDLGLDKKRTLSVVADIADNKLCEGKAVKMAILPDYLPIAGVQMPVKVINLDAEKGAILTNDNILYLLNFGKSPLSTKKQSANPQIKTYIPGAHANEFVFYTTKLQTSLSSDSPSGSFVPGYDTTIGKFKVCNNGTKNASIQYVNFNLYTYVYGAGGGASDFKAKVKIDEPAFSGDVLLEKEIAFFGETKFKDADFKDVMLASGACRDLRVRMDTTALKDISFNVQEVIWADALMHDIAANGNTLPTPFKTLVK